MLTEEKLDNIIAEMHKRRAKEEREYDGHRLAPSEVMRKSKTLMYVFDRSIEVEFQTAFEIMAADFKWTADWSTVTKNWPTVTKKS